MPGDVWRTAPRKRKKQLTESIANARKHKIPRTDDAPTPANHSDANCPDGKENDEKLAYTRTQLQKRRDELERENKNANERVGYWKKKDLKSKESLKALKAEVKELKGEKAGLEHALDRKDQEMEYLQEKMDVEKEKKRGYQKQIHAMKEQRTRAFHSAAKKLATMLGKKSPAPISTYDVKEKGVITDKTRDVLTDLVSLDGVGTNKVFRVFKRVANALGIEVEGTVHDRSSRRIVKEGGNASLLQFASAAGRSDGTSRSPARSACQFILYS